MTGKSWYAARKQQFCPYRVVYSDRVLGSFVHLDPSSLSHVLHQERNQSYLEEQILNQVNVVFEGQIFPAWISRQTVVHLKIGTHAPDQPKGTALEPVSYVHSPVIVRCVGIQCPLRQHRAFGWPGGRKSLSRPSRVT